MNNNTINILELPTEQRLILLLWSCGLWHSAVIRKVGTNISEEYSASIFMVEDGVIPKKKASLKWWYPSARHHGDIT
jgi:hypothetical protein